MSKPLRRVPAKLYDSATGWDPDVLIALGASEERRRLVRHLRKRGRLYLDKRGTHKTHQENARLTSAGRALTDEAAKIEGHAS